MRVKSRQENFPSNRLKVHPEDVLRKFDCGCTTRQCWLRTQSNNLLCICESIFSIFCSDFSFNDGKTFSSFFLRQLTMTQRASTSKIEPGESLCVHPRNVLEISIFYAPHNIQLWLSSAKSSNISAIFLFFCEMEAKKNTILSPCIQSLIRRREKNRTEEKKEKGALEIIKKAKLRNSEKIAICHAFQSLQQQICVYGFFSYMLDGSPMLNSRCSSVRIRRGAKKCSRARRSVKNGKKFISKMFGGWLWVTVLTQSLFRLYVGSISWGRFTFNIWIAGGVRGWR